MATADSAEGAVLPEDGAAGNDGIRFDGVVKRVLRDIANETDITMLCVTHEMGFARDVSNRVLMFDRGQIVEEGTPEKIFSRPDNQRTQDFLHAVLDQR